MGVLFVGSDITKPLKRLKDLMASIKVGKTGYMYVIDTSEKDKGKLIVHPAKTGQNILTSKDAKGREFVREMIEKKEGIIYYPWINRELGETSDRDKVVVYTHYDEWKWLIGIGTYVEEVEQEALYVRNMMWVTNIVGATLISLLIFIVIQRALMPIADIATRLEEVASGDFSRVGFGKGYRDRKDEIGLIARSIIKVEGFIQTMVREIKDAANLIQSVIGLLEKNIDTVKEKTNSQTSQAHQIATATEEQSSASEEVARSAEQTSILSNEVKAANEMVAQEVKELVGVAQKLAKVVKDVRV